MSSTRAKALRELGLVIADAAAVFTALTPQESAQRVWVPGDPPVPVLAAQIADHRATYQAAAA